ADWIMDVDHDLGGPEDEEWTAEPGTSDGVKLIKWFFKTHPREAERIERDFEKRLWRGELWKTGLPKRPRKHSRRLSCATRSTTPLPNGARLTGFAKRIEAALAVSDAELEAADAKARVKKSGRLDTCGSTAPTRSGRSTSRT